MSDVEQNSGFKYVFWGILILVFIAFVSQSMWMVLTGFKPFFHLFGIGHNGPWIWGPYTNWPRLVVTTIPTIILFLAWVGIVAPLVYRDAKKRGMDPYLWATVAVFIPFFLGIIIYLVVRSNGQATCENCSKPIRSDYKVCPYCGHRRELLCPGCNKPIAAQWKVCPYCEHKLVSVP